MMNPEQSEPWARISRIRTLFKFEHQKLGLTLFLVNAFWIFSYFLDMGSTLITLSLGGYETSPFGWPGVAFVSGSILLFVTAGNFYMLFHKHIRMGRASMISWGLLAIMMLFLSSLHFLAGLHNLLLSYALAKT